MQLNPQALFLIWFWLTVTFFWVPIAWTMMRYATPRALVATYFKEPHFSRAELFLCSHFPGTLLRTGIFMAACFQERYRRGRMLQGYLDMVPTWYIRASKLFCFALFLHGGAMIGLLTVLYFWPESAP